MNFLLSTHFIRLLFIILASCSLSNFISSQTTIILKKESGLYVVPCTVNGLREHFILDPGSTEVLVSMEEASSMLKNGQLKGDEVPGKISEGSIIVLREIIFAGFKLQDVKARVIKNLEAPLRLGTNALSKLGKIQFDPKTNKLSIYPETQSTVNKSIVVNQNKSEYDPQCFTVKNNQIKWVSFKEALELQKTDRRKIMVDIYTDWCGWCKRMDASTFQDPRVIKYLNKYYYAVKLNAEQKETILFKSRNFKFIPSGQRGVHELAVEITNGQLSYPTFVFMDEDFNTIQPLPGYLDADTFEIISNYFGGNHYKTTPYESFQEKFKATLKK